MKKKKKKTKKQKITINETQNINEEINNYIQKYKQFISKDIYITKKMYSIFLNKYKYLYPYIHHDHPQYKFLKEIVTDKNKIIRVHNHKYLNHKVKTYNDYFNTITLNTPLDNNQKQAIICEENNLLFISKSASDKITTISTKVKCLIDIMHYKPEEIAVISSTNESYEKLKSQIHATPNYQNVDIYTLNTLALKILKNTTNDKLDIIDSPQKISIFTSYIKQALFNNKQKFDNFYHAFAPCLGITSHYQDFKTFKDYHDYMYKRKYLKEKVTMANYIKNTINKRRNNLQTIKGEYVKSKEDVDIANFLYLNCINYEYQKIYKPKSSPKAIKGDFYIYQDKLYNYIKHLDINNQFHNDSFTPQELDNYLNSLQLKSELHEKERKQNLFIITTSDMTIKERLTHLANSLQEKGYTLTKPNHKDIYETLKNTSEDIYFDNFIEKLLIPFISSIKNSNYHKESLLQLKKTTTPHLALQIDVILDFYDYYEQYLHEHNLIDSDDLINRCYNLINKTNVKDLKINYKYLIIDEYQDIIPTRHNLITKLKSILKAKIFAVNSECQNNPIFNDPNLKKYLNNTKLIPIENTYCHSKELLNLTTEFITQSLEKIKKKETSNKKLTNHFKIYIYNDSDPINTNYHKAKTLDIIMQKINQDDKTLILGKYNKDIDTITNNDLFTKKNQEQITWLKNPTQKINFSTINTPSKQCYDAVILLNIIDDQYNFPYNIEDIPLIKLIKSTEDKNIAIIKEKYLLYTALTITKNKIYILCPHSKVSTIIQKIATNKKTQK